MSEPNYQGNLSFETVSSELCVERADDAALACKVQNLLPHGFYP